MTARWINLGNGRSVFRSVQPAPKKRSDLPAPMLVRDQMPELWHPSTGEVIDSKSHFREITRRSGGVEVGNDTQVDRRTYDQAAPSDVAEAVQKVKQGYRPPATDEGSEGWH